MPKLNRRNFLYAGALAGGAVGLQGLMACLTSDSASYGDLLATKNAGAYGALRPVASQNTGETLLALPEGFQYTVFGKTGSIMADKHPTPGSHDGMAAFAGADGIRLVRNHEITHNTGTPGIAFGDRKRAYDPLAGGGTTTLILNPDTREVVRDFVSLSGTLQNCAGGPTPWGSWISCEENTLGHTMLGNQDGRQTGGFEQSHGYCFEVPAAADEQVAPVPLKAMGRFVHEAVAVDPASGVVYLTEDQPTAGFYQFIPNEKANLQAGGRLQMLAVKGRPKYDTRVGQKVGVPLPVEWVDITKPDPPEVDSESRTVYREGAAGGAATFARLEGCCYGNGKIFASSTSGGEKRLGQVWAYQPDGTAGGTLTLIFETPAPDIMNMPDNLCLSPRGGLVICEDSGQQNYIRGLTREGRIFEFAKNIMPRYENAEFAGATYSPDGRTLFVNIQAPGLTFAIWGAWENGAL